MANKNRVVIGMSGGVDSTVAAHLLKEQGYEVIGVMMKLWEETEDFPETGKECCTLSAANDARRVADRLGIPFYVLNFTDVFKKTVVADFMAEYAKGRTPNPCILCNRVLKFDELLAKALELDAHYVATGHYAAVKTDPDTGRYYIERLPSDKDQSYVLYNLTQEQLSHTLMPLADFTDKEKVREVAASLDAVISRKRDSQEICFIPDNDYHRFLDEHSPHPVTKGHFVDEMGRALAEHKGLRYYTIGQRKGLGVSFGKPMYVADMDAHSGNIRLGDNPETYAPGLVAGDFNWMAIEAPEGMLRCKAKIRYNHREAPAQVHITGEGVTILFDEDQRAITPGQAVVLYEGDKILGGGTIESVLRKRDGVV